MTKKEPGKIKIILNLVEHEENENSFLPAFLLLDWKGNYKKNLSKIQKALDIGDRGEILNILYFSEDKKTNSYELAKLTNHAYSLINKYVKDLKKLGLVKLSKGKSKRGRPALTVEKDERVKIVPYSKFIESKDFEQSINHELYWARESEKKFKQSLKIDESIKKAPKIPKTKK